MSRCLLLRQFCSHNFYYRFLLLLTLKNILLLLLVNVNCGTQSTKFHVVFNGPCLNETTDFCHSKVPNSVCSTKTNVCFCKPGYGSIIEFNRIVCKSFLTDIVCYSDSDCTHVDGSTCHPESSRCICPAETIYVHQLHACRTQYLGQNSDLCNACRRLNGKCFTESVSDSTRRTGKQHASASGGGDSASSFSGSSSSSNSRDRSRRRSKSSSSNSNSNSNTETSFNFSPQCSCPFGRINIIIQGQKQHPIQLQLQLQRLQHQQPPPQPPHNNDNIASGDNKIAIDRFLCTGLAVDIGQYCDGIRIICQSKRAVCTNRNTALSFCYCPVDYVPVYQPNLDYHECYKKAKYDDSLDCKMCQLKEGICFVKEGSKAKSRYGCRCPSALANSLLLTKLSRSSSIDISTAISLSSFSSDSSSELHSLLSPSYPIDLSSPTDSSSSSSSSDLSSDSSSSVTLLKKKSKWGSNKIQYNSRSIKSCLSTLIKVTCQSDVIRICVKPNTKEIHQRLLLGLSFLYVSRSESSYPNVSNSCVLKRQLNGNFRELFCVHLSLPGTGKVPLPCGLSAIQYLDGLLLQGQLNFWFSRYNRDILRDLRIDFSCKNQHLQMNEMTGNVIDRSNTLNPETPNSDARKVHFVIRNLYKEPVKFVKKDDLIYMDIELSKQQHHYQSINIEKCSLEAKPTNSNESQILLIISAPFMCSKDPHGKNSSAFQRLSWNSVKYFERKTSEFFTLHNLNIRDKSIVKVSCAFILCRKSSFCLKSSPTHSDCQVNDRRQVSLKKGSLRKFHSKYIQSYYTDQQYHSNADRMYYRNRKEMIGKQRRKESLQLPAIFLVTSVFQFVFLSTSLNSEKNEKSSSVFPKKTSLNAMECNESLCLTDTQMWLVSLFCLLCICALLIFIIYLYRKIRYNYQHQHHSLHSHMQQQQQQQQQHHSNSTPSPNTFSLQLSSNNSQIKKQQQLHVQLQQQQQHRYQNSAVIPFNLHNNTINNDNSNNNSNNNNSNNIINNNSSSNNNNNNNNNNNINDNTSPRPPGPMFDVCNPYITNSLNNMILYNTLHENKNYEHITTSPARISMDTVRLLPSNYHQPQQYTNGYHVNDADSGPVSTNIGEQNLNKPNNDSLNINVVTPTTSHEQRDCCLAASPTTQLMCQCRNE